MKTNHQDLNHFNVGDLFKSNDKYFIPVYQRNYEWGDKQLIQLLDDIRDYYIENEDKKYFTGTLVCDLRKDTGFYEAIDGQQRLTTFNLILCALRHLEIKDSETDELVKSIYSSPNIYFEARPISDNSIEHVFLNGNVQPKFSDYNPNIISATSIIEAQLKKIHRELESEDVERELVNKSFNGFINYFFNKVIIVRVQVPEKTDLNHYFEIMNSRGEQLEKHEILKSRLMKFLNESEDAKLVRRQFNLIWEACSQMDNYVQLSFQKNLRSKVFGRRWFSFDLDSFDSLSSNLNLEDKDSENSIKFNEIVEAKSAKEVQNKINKLNNEDIINESDSNQFQPIINFENFLLHVLKIQCPNLEISLDDKRLLHFFKIAIEKSESKERFAKDFIYNLLKLRFLIDTYVIKRKYQGNDNFWSLETLKFYPKNTEGREKDSFNYLNTCKQGDFNNELVLLQSMFHVSTPTLVYKYWLFSLLKYLNENLNQSHEEMEYPLQIEALDYQNHMIDTAKSFLKYRFLNPVKERSYDDIFSNKLEPFELRIEDRLLSYGNIKNNLIFNYIDYLLWKKDEIREKVESSNHKFSFSFRSSVEHFFPQHPISGDSMSDKKLLNCIGNLCLISHENNSRYSNFLPDAKRNHYKNAATKESIKQSMMMEKADNWYEAEVLEHKNYIHKLLEDDLNNITG